MKKFLTISMIMLGIMSTSAQDFEYTFVDEQGNAISDGSTITRNTVEENIMGVEGQSDYMINSGLYIKYIGTKTSTDEMTDEIGIMCDIKDMPTGAFQICYPMNCSTHPSDLLATEYPFSEEGFDTDADIFNRLDPVDILAEWIFTMPYPKDAKSNTYNVDLQLYKKTMFGKAMGPKITIKFVNEQATGIKNITANSEKTIMHYSLSGQKTMSAARGITIAKLANGKIIKYIK